MPSRISLTLHAGYGAVARLMRTTSCDGYGSPLSRGRTESKPSRAAARHRLVLGAARRQAAFHLPIGALRDLDQPLARGRAAHHIADLALDPQHRSRIARGVVAQRRARRVGARAIERVALAGGRLVHE